VFSPDTKHLLVIGAAAKRVKQKKPWKLKTMQREDCTDPTRVVQLVANLLKGVLSRKVFSPIPSISPRMGMYCLQSVITACEADN